MALLEGLEAEVAETEGVVPSVIALLGGIVTELNEFKALGTVEDLQSKAAELSSRLDSTNAALAEAVAANSPAPEPTPEPEPEPEPEPAPEV